MKFKLIQVFRGVAAMLVIMHHLIANSINHLNYVTYNNFFNFGFIGVDFFFVLSGFLITYIHFPDLESPKKDSTINFFKKRFIRIYPIYWVVAIITTAIYFKSTPIFMQEAGIKMDFNSLQTLKFLFQSFLLIPNEAIRLIGVAWTLSYEILFYIIFGIGIIFGFKKAKIIAGVWIVLILIFSFTPPSNNEYLRFLFNVIIIEFLMGCVVAYLIRKKINISFKYTLPLIIILFVLLLKNIHINGLVFHRDIYNVTLMALFFSLITYSCVRFDQKNTSIKIPALLILIGDASYSIYLSHNMFLSALTRACAKLNPTFLNKSGLPIITTIIFLITIFLGIIIHLLLEKKLLKVINNKAFLPKNNIVQMPVLSSYVWLKVFS
jgi:exopolysaccharide production protein ExoZ